MRGFTLLELIVVILLIAFLLFLIVPILGHHHDEGRRTQCASNLKQIGIAMSMYADVPGNDILPTNSTTKDPFAAQAMPSLNLIYDQYITDPNVFSCPSNPIPELLRKGLARSDLKGKIIGTPMSSANCSYGYDPGHDSNAAVTALAADRKGNGVNSNNHGLDAGQNMLIGGGIVVFHTTPQNVLSETESGSPKSDPNIFSLNPEIPRNDDSFIRQ